MRKIALAKIGKSIKFGGAFSPVGGDNEPGALVRALANNNPDDHFYLIGRSDYSRLEENEKKKLFPYSNVTDIWEGFKAKHEEDVFNHVNKKHDEIGFDHGVVMFGQVGTVTIPNTIEQVKHRHLTASVIEMTKNYSTPIVKWFNERKVPWIEIQNDPRYHSNQSRDLFGLPHTILSQYTYVLKSKHIQSYKEQDTVLSHTDCVYAGVETLYLVDRKLPDIIELSRSKKTPFMVVLNEGKPSRYNMLKDWVLDSNTDVEIYGKWDDQRALEDSRFKGSLHIDELSKKLQDVKYSLVIPIAPGWVTSKYIELIHNGVIPFFHPTYDTQRHINVPEILRLKRPGQLAETIKYFEENSDAYQEVLKDLQRLLKPEYYDGTFISKKIMKNIDPTYTLPDLSKYSKAETNSLEDFFS
jgi:hypothetical protein